MLDKGHAAASYDTRSRYKGSLPPVRPRHVRHAAVATGLWAVGGWRTALRQESVCSDDPSPGKETRWTVRCATRSVAVSPRRLITVFLTLVALLLCCTHAPAADILASNKHPLSFGPGQTLIDLKKIVWEPLGGEGSRLAPGWRCSTAISRQAEVSCWSTSRPTIPFLTTAIPVTSSMCGSMGTLPISGSVLKSGDEHFRHAVQRNSD